MGVASASLASRPLRGLLGDALAAGDGADDVASAGDVESAGDVASAGEAPSTMKATAPAAANKANATTTSATMQQRRFFAGGFLSARTLFAPGSDRAGPRSVTMSPVVDLTTSNLPPLSVPADELLSLATDLERASCMAEDSESTSKSLC